MKTTTNSGRHARNRAFLGVSKFLVALAIAGVLGGSTGCVWVPDDEYHHHHDWDHEHHDWDHHDHDHWDHD